MSQFGEDKFDLQLSNEIAQNKLKDVLKHLVDIGVKGFRLANAKHFVINTEKFENEGPGSQIGEDLNSYNFWSHTQTIYQDDMKNVLRNLSRFVANITHDEGFLTITDDMMYRPEAYEISENPRVYGFELPNFGELPQKISKEPKSLLKYFDNVFQNNTSPIWPQWSVSLWKFL